MILSESFFPFEKFALPSTKSGISFIAKPIHKTEEVPWPHGIKLKTWKFRKFREAKELPPQSQ
jgi:hypothetical protein